MVAPVDNEDLAPYCAECSVTLGRPARYAVALGHAQQHARITGHVVVLADASWTVVDTVYGEPSLPLWDP